MSSSSQTILVVEDNADARLLFRKALVMKGYEIRQAANGHEALKSLDALPCPALVLLDLSMPKMTGAEFMKHLKTHPTCSGVKVAIISGWDGLENIAGDLGAEGFIKKPVDLDALYDEVARLLLPTQDQEQVCRRVHLQKLQILEGVEKVDSILDI